MGLARRNLENLERDKTVKIMQGFSFEFEEAKMMVAILVPEVKSANGVNTFQVFTSEKTILTWEVLQKLSVCPPSYKSALSSPALELCERLSQDLQLKHPGTGCGFIDVGFAVHLRHIYADLHCVEQYDTDS